MLSVNPPLRGRMWHCKRCTRDWQREKSGRFFAHVVGRNLTRDGTLAAKCKPLQGCLCSGSTRRGWHEMKFSVRRVPIHGSFYYGPHGWRRGSGNYRRNPRNKISPHVWTGKRHRVRRLQLRQSFFVLVSGKQEGSEWRGADLGCRTSRDSEMTRALVDDPLTRSREGKKAAADNPWQK